MTRVSLKEAYDNKDVVAQIYAIRDIAEGAEDIANGAVSTANTASEHVDALVPRVEGAVQNANDASSSAQASAQTVTGYENRLSAVESETAGLDSDLGAVTLRVTTAEGNIVTIQGRVTALETADGQNVKITGEHAIGNYAVLLTGNQDKSGNLNMLSRTDYPNRTVDIFNPPSYASRGISEVKAGPEDANTAMREEFTFATGGNSLAFTIHCGDADGVTDHTATLVFTVFRDGKARLQLQRESGTVQIVPQG